MTEPGSAVTGSQFEIRRAGGRAVVTELAAGLRLYERDGTALTETYGTGTIAPVACGILLAPWPNRIADGRWLLDGVVQQLDITEPARGHATHGLLRNTGYRVEEQSGDSLRLTAGIFPQHGYPFHLTHTVSYRLGDDAGLTVRQSLLNHSAVAAPVALGAHPYLRIGEVETADLTVTVTAATRLVSDERLIPAGREPVAGHWDLRAGRRVGDLDLDCAYTDLGSANTGTDFDGVRWEQTLTAPDGRSVALWGSGAFRYVQIFVTDRFPGRPTAIAMEPMTAPANALNSGEGLHWLPPGETMTAEWGIRAQLGNTV